MADEVGGRTHLLQDLHSQMPVLVRLTVTLPQKVHGYLEILSMCFSLYICFSMLLLGVLLDFDLLDLLTEGRTVARTVLA